MLKNLCHGILTKHHAYALLRHMAIEGYPEKDPTVVRLADGSAALLQSLVMTALQTCLLDYTASGFTHVTARILQPYIEDAFREWEKELKEWG